MDNYSPLQSEEPLQDNPITEPVVKPVFWHTPMGAFLIELIETLALAGILYGMIDFVVARVRVENISMRPTLEPGQFLLVNKMAYKTGEMNRGDIVIFHHSVSEDYIKRLIGLPGDQVEIQHGAVSVNGQVLDEPYIAAAPNYSGVWDVPQGSVFVLGDNRNQSSDSHSWGFVPVDKLVGKALAIYWPFQNARVLTAPGMVDTVMGEAP